MRWLIRLKSNFLRRVLCARLKQRVGLTDIEVAYSRPGVKGREIFGAMIPYGKVWRTGANSATKLVFSTDVKIDGHDIPAGTYALMTIPDKDEWTVIINKGSDQWGSYKYDEKDRFGAFQSQTGSKSHLLLKRSRLNSTTSKMSPLN